MNLKFLSSGLILCAATMASDASALSTHAGNFDFALTGYGTAGIIEPNFDKPDFVGDFRLRGQIGYNISHSHALGIVYLIDEDAVYEKDWKHDAFAFWQWRRVGRVEAGFTDSVAHKLGLGLPDVGGLRLNHNSLIYRKMGTDGPVIANPTITTGADALRVNIVSASNSNVQYGMSVSGITGDYDFGADVGIKIKYSENKTKYALSLGGSFIDKPNGYSPEDICDKVTADWRAQIALGLNVQYNSWIFALTGRVIYDENPIGTPADGFVTGAGLSYDLLKYTLSLSYLFSDTGVFHDNADNYADHTVVGSFRYKYSEYIDGWASLGLSRGEPFVAAGLRLTF